MTPRASSWIQIGVVGKAHGLRGHFFISHRDHPLPDTCKNIVIGDQPTQFSDLFRGSIKSSILINGRCAVCLNEITQREQIQPLLGKKIWAQRHDLMTENSSGLLIVDLVGKKIVDANADKIGFVDDIHNFGAGDIMGIKTSEESKRADFYLPMIKTIFDLETLGNNEVVRLKITRKDLEDYRT